MNHECGTSLKPCKNKVEHQICNRFVAMEDIDATLCDYCELNRIIPDLNIVGNVEKWRRLELAKHRTLYGVEQLGFPICTDRDTREPWLTFEFKADAEVPVSTGHANGCITINLVEADTVERERIRVAFGEPQRTLVGHFRHELGHYYWDLLVKPDRLPEFRKVFGDEANPDYATAQKEYYESGPVQNWQESFISGYASMHPWEDFAETFAVYLDINALLSSASHFQLLPENETTGYDEGDIDSMLRVFRQIGIAANELNRDLGLIDLVPEVLTPEVLGKVRFIHDLPRG